MTLGIHGNFFSVPLHSGESLDSVRPRFFCLLSGKESEDRDNLVRACVSFIIKSEETVLFS